MTTAALSTVVIPAHLLPDARQPHPCSASHPSPAGVMRCGLRVVHDGPVHADLTRRAAWFTYDAMAAPRPLQVR